MFRGWGCYALQGALPQLSLEVMPISRNSADRCLQLLWECRGQTKAPAQLEAYKQAISSLHAYLTDVLPATLPCVRAQAAHGVIEIFPDPDAPAQDIELNIEEGAKLGIVLDSVDVNGLNTASPIVVSLLRPHSVATRDGRIARGDQVLSINGHSLTQVSLQRARYDKLHYYLTRWTCANCTTATSIAWRTF